MDWKCLPLVALAACYSIPEDTCIQCMNACPPGMRCDNGFCVEPGHTSTCSLATTDAAASAWPCSSTMPGEPDAMMQFMVSTGTQVTITGIDVNGSRVLAVAPGEPLTVHAHYKIMASCSSCTEQLEIGFIPGTRLSCPFDQYLSGNTAEGDLNVMVAAPMLPNAYDLRIALGENINCDFFMSNWYYGEPADTQTLAHLCVH